MQPRNGPACKALIKLVLARWSGLVVACRKIGALTLLRILLSWRRWRYTIAAVASTSLGRCRVLTQLGLLPERSDDAGERLVHLLPEVEAGRLHREELSARRPPCTQQQAGSKSVSTKADAHSSAPTLPSTPSYHHCVMLDAIVL